MREDPGGLRAYTELRINFQDTTALTECLQK